MSRAGSDASTTAEMLRERLEAAENDIRDRDAEISRLEKHVAELDLIVTAQKAVIARHNEAVILRRRMTAVNDAHVFLKTIIPKADESDALGDARARASIKNLGDDRNKTFHFCTNDKLFIGMYRIECLLASEFADPSKDSSIGTRYMHSIDALRRRLRAAIRIYHDDYIAARSKFVTISPLTVSAWIKEGTF